MHTAKAIASAVFLTWVFCIPATAARRVALVIGNSAYQNVNRLINPRNDAEAISATFKSAGFDFVSLRLDLIASDMRRALREFSDVARDADIAIVYFAGHGIEIDGTNYLIPTDAVLERDIDAFDEAVSLDRITTVVEPARQLRLIILDACRDNPFGKTVKRTVSSRSINRGLAKVEPGSPNTLIAFAAKAGSTAADGDSKNSPFTSALVKYLPRPGLDIRKAFGFARDEVLKVTNMRQEPFIYGSLGGDDVALVPAIDSQSTIKNPQSLNDAARQDYELAERIGTRSVWDSFIGQYPSGFYAELAKAQREKIKAGAINSLATETPKATAETPHLITNATTPSVHTDTATDQKILTAKADTAEQPSQVTSSGSPLGDDISRQLQTELGRVGCNAGAIDDSWNNSAQKSLRLFNENAQTKFDTKYASLEALDAVRSKSGRVCPVVCNAGYQLAHDDTCERIEVKKREKPIAKLSPSSESKSEVMRDDNRKRNQQEGSRFSPKKLERVGSAGCSSLSARCAVEIGGRCSNGRWEYGRNGAGGSVEAFNTCIGRQLAASKR